MLQYYLAVIGAYYEAVQPVEITGYFGEKTEKSVNHSREFSDFLRRARLTVLQEMTSTEHTRAL